MSVVAKPHSYRDDASVPPFDDSRPIVVFDGVCVLCAGSMHFILRHDRNATFRFLVAQSALGQALYRHYGLLAEDFDTVLVIDDGRLHARLDSVAAVLRHLPMPWPLLSFVRLLPNVFYDFVAKRRYRWFGQRDACLMPAPELRERFLSDGWIPAQSS
ncbi:MAG: thiol-disulfide oxidoreductase DCC family protein [Panacagrimonas sp.]